MPRHSPHAVFLMNRDDGVDRNVSDIDWRLFSRIQLEITFGRPEL